MPQTSNLEAPSDTARSPKKERSTGSSDPASSPEKNKPMRKAHFVLQGKGGVGKTFVASLIAQYLTERGEPVACLDTDQVNSSFQDITALGARPVKILNEDSEEIDIAEMDGMVERILTEDSHFVVDNGATLFVPMSRYLVQDGAVEAIGGAGKRVVVHTIVAGGPELVHTGRGFHAVVRQFPAEVEIVLWLNEHHGEVRGADGKGFEDTPVYQEARHRLSGTIRLPRLNPHTFGANLTAMLARNMTFAEADRSGDFFAMAKQRLRQIKRPIFDQMAPIG
jgi:CobQ/CobB/MinD/ParA nucleotide binding domain